MRARQGAVGAARSCYRAALDYAADREQFGRPIAGFQLTQRKLADMVVDVNHSAMTSLRLGRLKDEGRAHHNHVSFGKFANVAAAQRVASSARGLHGANGITLEYHDQLGHHRVASDAVKRALLAAIGVPVSEVDADGDAAGGVGP